MSAQADEIEARVRSIYERAAFVQALGIRLESAAAGTVTAVLPVRPDHLQQDGLVHAGVLATMADHAAGAAAVTGVAPEETVLSVEFKLNLLRPARGPELRVRAEVLRQGRRLCVVESSVFGGPRDAPELVAKATVTLAVVPADVGRRGALRPGRT
ncbi:MAG TPA: PaaI family thioesterase [Myxococcaceae bacterium]|jgi:uncharacterized protein (TIGR00369 family)|nr:PaaI family thioesterase [Myxococcaceae bacterium]